MKKDEIKNVQPHDGNALLAADAVIAGMFVKIEHPHKCTCIAVAPAMGEGREWFIGKLDEHLPEYPHETHCLHLKTQYKDVTFLCNEADFRNLLIICRAVIGQPHEDWLKSMVEWSLQKAGSICR